jgi:hypothetical protein
MSKRKYDVDNRVFFEEGKIISHKSQDVDPTLRSVQAIKHENGGRIGGMVHAARIPQLVLMQWGVEDAGDQNAYLQGRHNKDPELAIKFSARLNSNEFNLFRIWEGNVAASDMLKEGDKLVGAKKED